jgi:hypothetical protein
MNYRNYEAKIVEKYGVALTGWPSEIPRVCNPSTVGGRVLLEKLFRALELGECHWIVLSDDELEARRKENVAKEKRGEMVYQPRKSSSRRKKGEKSREMIDEDDEEGSGSDSHDSDGDGNGDGDGDGGGNGDGDDSGGSNVGGGSVPFDMVVEK